MNLIKQTRLLLSTCLAFCGLAQDALAIKFQPPQTLFLAEADLSRPPFDDVTQNSQNPTHQLSFSNPLSVKKSKGRKTRKKGGRSKKGSRRGTSTKGITLHLPLPI